MRCLPIAIENILIITINMRQSRSLQSRTLWIIVPDVKKYLCLKITKIWLHGWSSNFFFQHIHQRASHLPKYSRSYDWFTNYQIQPFLGRLALQHSTNSTNCYEIDWFCISTKVQACSLIFERHANYRCRLGDWCKDHNIMVPRHDLH